MSKDKGSKDSQVVGNRYKDKARRHAENYAMGSGKLKEVPVKPPVNAVAVVANLSVQIRAQKLEGFGERKSIEAMIGYALATTNLNPQVATAIVSMAYNTTLELIAQALEDTKN